MTIKTQVVGGETRIITKVVDGSTRVSCACCAAESECCMYPAQGLLDGDYTAADLPDSVLVSNAGFASGTYTKNGSIYERGNVTLEAVIFPAGTTGRWAFFRDGDEEGDRGEPCLIAPENTQQVTDFFADGYDYDNAGVGQTGFIERTSLCVWSDQLYYYAGNNPTLEFYYNGPLHRWIFIRTGLQQEEGGGVWEKDDPQNGPLGTYSPSTNVTGNSFAGLGTITLTEP
jgi:hypothetical protein